MDGLQWSKLRVTSWCMVPYSMQHAAFPHSTARTQGLPQLSVDVTGGKGTWKEGNLGSPRFHRIGPRSTTDTPRPWNLTLATWNGAPTVAHAHVQLCQGTTAPSMRQPS
jgi:hypothetical protein